MAPTLKYTNKLQGKRVLVIGGTSGIGFGVAEACVEYGATVIVASSRQEKIDKTIERLATSYPDAKARVSGHPVDLASPDVEVELTKLYEFATDGGKVLLDHVVNTAGDLFGLTKLEDATVEKVQKVGTVRYMGSVMMAKLAMKYVNKSVKSSLTLTGGVNSTKPGPGWSMLAGWGAAKEGLTRGLAVDMKPIRVNSVSPGAIETELFDSFGGLGTKEQLLEYYRAKSLTGTCGTPEDIAEAYLYLMKDSFVTGINLISDGGYLLA